MKAIALFVAHWNAPEPCLASVASLLSQEIPLQITVLDNGSSPENLRKLRHGLPAGIRLIELGENRGFGGALNVGLTGWLEAGGDPDDFCFLSSHDTLVREGCLKLLADAMSASARTGIACPDYGVPVYPKYFPIRGPRSLPCKPLAKGMLQDLDFPNATLLAVRRACLSQIGLFDEFFFTYGEEYDLGLRASRSGWRVVLVWGATVMNPGRSASSTTYAYLHGRNSLFLARRYGGKPAAAVRTFLFLAHTLVLMVRDRRRHSLKEFGWARFRAVRDFLLGVGGPPSNAVGKAAQGSRWVEYSRIP